MAGKLGSIVLLYLGLFSVCSGSGKNINLNIRGLSERIQQDAAASESVVRAMRAGEVLVKGGKTPYLTPQCQAEVEVFNDALKNESLWAVGSK